MGTIRARKCWQLLGLLLAVLLIFSFSAYAENDPENGAENEAFNDEDYTKDTDDNELWYVVRVSEPDGNGGGKAVLLEYDAELDLPPNGEYRWYACDQSGLAGDLLGITVDNRFEAEAFDKPEIRYYRCELSAGGEDYEHELFAVGFTGLPLIRINTEDEEEIAYHDYYLSGTMAILDGKTVLNLPVSVKGRGNATFFNYPKKPYTIKLENKIGLLGMKKAKKWALLAGYCDKTLLRAALGFKTSELMGLAYTPAYRYVDLVINDEYVGNYLLAETVKEEAKRLDFSGDGFVVEETQYDTDDDPSFYSEKKQLRYRFRYPAKEDVTTATIETVSMEINQLEKAILNMDGEDADLPDNIDVDSWINWLLVQNVLANIDTNKYYYKTDSNAKICMGPVWDFEWSVGIGWYDGERPNPKHELTLNTDYFRKLMENRQFLRKLEVRWQEVSRDLTDTLIGFMDDTVQEIYFSRELNFRRWTIMNQKISVGGIPMGSYEAEIECDKDFLREHIQWLNEQIGGM